MRPRWNCLILAAWMAYLLSSSLFLFMNGFLLNRVARTERSDCALCESEENCDARKIFKNNRASANVCPPPRARVVLLIVDALKYEFLEWRRDVVAGSSYHLNRLPVVRDLLASRPNNTRLFKFVADPPTTTAQRLTALTTGTLPTFVDASANFAAGVVDEDNLVEQAARRGGTVFMGDDTWASLFPGKFLRQYPSPSFDVRDLDSVDRSVRRLLPSELRRKDWSLLVAHVLGVDHCGHRYGARHPEMARKLDETDGAIRDIVRLLDDDAVLFVAGDHGMTESGDHGGDGRDETEAGLFVFSKIPLLERPDGARTTIDQVDLVPTVASILGISVPFSNIGALVPECLPLGERSDRDDRRFWFAAHSAWRNVVQVKKYVETYSRDSALFREDRSKMLDDAFDAVERDAGNVRDAASARRFLRGAESYVKAVKKLCADIWVKFDPGSMSKGSVIFFSALFFVRILSSAVDATRTDRLMRSNFLPLAAAANVVASSATFLLRRTGFIAEFRNANLFATGAASITLLAFLVARNWDFISSTWYRDLRRKRIDYWERAIFLLAFCGPFSNSYVVEENGVASFLLVASIFLLVYKTIESGAFVSPTNGEKTPRSDDGGDGGGGGGGGGDGGGGDNDDDDDDDDVARSKNVRYFVIFAGAVACAAARLSSLFWHCREEQDPRNCKMFVGKAAFPNNVRFERVLLILGAPILAFYAAAIPNRLRASERRSQFSSGANIVKYCCFVMAVATGCRWVLDELSKDARFVVVVAGRIDALARSVYVVGAAGIAFVYLRPLGVSLFHGRKERTSLFDRDGTIKKLFRTIGKLFSIRKPVRETEEFLQVYDLQTLYSWPFVSLSVFVLLLWALVLGSAFALGTFLMFVTCAAILIVVAIERFSNANNIAELSQAPSSGILCWFLTAEYFFYGTGHHSTFSSIQWDAAFVGADGNFYGNFFPAVLIGLNTFGSFLFAALTLPLLTIVPFTVYATIPTIVKFKFHPRSDMRKGELILYESDSYYRGAVASTYGKYIALHGMRTFGCMLAATVHCRHLMVWKIFAPKLIFEGLSFLVSVGSILASALLLYRIDRRMDDVKLPDVMKIR